MIYELWKTGEGSDAELDFFPADGDPRRHAGLPDGAELIWTVEADSWTAACSAMHGFLGWDEYVPVDAEYTPEGSADDEKCESGE